MSKWKKDFEDAARILVEVENHLNEHEGDHWHLMEARDKLTNFLRDYKKEIELLKIKP